MTAVRTKSLGSAQMAGSSAINIGRGDSSLRHRSGCRAATGTLLNIFPATAQADGTPAPAPAAAGSSNLPHCASVVHSDQTHLLLRQNASSLRFEMALNPDFGESIIGKFSLFSFEALLVSFF
jgi:hypothetical protein